MLPFCSHWGILLMHTISEIVEISDLIDFHCLFLCLKFVSRHKSLGTLIVNIEAKKALNVSTLSASFIALNAWLITNPHSHLFFHCSILIIYNIPCYFNSNWASAILIPPLQPQAMFLSSSSAAFSHLHLQYTFFLSWSLVNSFLFSQASLLIHK